MAPTQEDSHMNREEPRRIALPGRKRRIRTIRFCLPASFLLLLVFAITPEILAAEGEDIPSHVILIIGDGMDDQQITIARNYLVGATGRMSLDELPVRSAAQVLTVDEEDPSKAVYVADSANSATSIATGVTTSRGRVGTSAGKDLDLTTIVELARASGLKTGLVSTSDVTDATPACFAAHVSRRFCADPAHMVDIEYKGFALGGCPEDLIANGGSGSISEQLANSGVDVILGGGSERFSVPTEAGGQTVRQLAEENGYRVVETLSQLEKLPPGGRMLGLFSPGTMPVRTRGENGRVAEKPEPSLLNRVHWYLGSVELPEPMTCEPNPDYGKMPSLKSMTDAALKQLAHSNDKGFFLMIESASIDKQAHARSACGSIGELEQLNEAVDSALAFAEEHPRTLILVTADHGHAAQIIPYESLFGQFGAPVYTPGHLVRLITVEGAGMAVNYASNDFMAEEHTGTQVPLLANDEGRDLVPGMVDQPEIFDIMLKYLNLPRNIRAEAD